jgi:hypothetical protein
MARFRGTVVSPWSIEETFDYLADFSNAAEWDPGVDRARWRRAPSSGST